MHHCFEPNHSSHPVRWPKRAQKSQSPPQKGDGTIIRKQHRRAAWVIKKGTELIFESRGGKFLPAPRVCTVNRPDTSLGPAIVGQNSNGADNSFRPLFCVDGADGCASARRIRSVPFSGAEPARIVGAVGSASAIQLGEQLVDLAVEKPRAEVEMPALGIGIGQVGSRAARTQLEQVVIVSRLGRGRALAGLGLLARTHVELDRDIAERQLFAERIEQVPLIRGIE